MKKGFSLIEIIIIIAITVIVATIVFVSFSRLNKSQALDKDTLLVISTLNEARSQTLASKDSAAYGVHFNEFEIVIYEGPTYSAGDSTNRTFALSDHTRVSATTISGGGSDVLFQRLNGKTNHTGTVTLALRTDSTSTKTITIYGTGTIESN